MGCCSSKKGATPDAKSGKTVEVVKASEAKPVSLDSKSAHVKLPEDSAVKPVVVGNGRNLFEVTKTSAPPKFEEKLPHSDKADAKLPQSQLDHDNPPPPAESDPLPVHIESKMEAKSLDSQNPTTAALANELSENHVPSDKAAEYSKLLAKHGITSLAALHAKLLNQATFVDSCGIHGKDEDAVLSVVGLKPRKDVVHSKWQTIKASLHDISNGFSVEDKLSHSLSNTRHQIELKRVELFDVVNAVCGNDESMKSLVLREFGDEVDAIVARLTNNWQTAIQGQLNGLMTELSSLIFLHVVVFNQQMFESSLRVVENKVRQSIMDIGTKYDWSNEFVGKYLDEPLDDVAALISKMRTTFTLFEYEVNDAQERLARFCNHLEDRLGQTDYGMMDIEFKAFQDGQFDEMDRLQGPMPLDNDFGDKLRQHAKHEIEEMVNGKKEDIVRKWYVHNDWQFSACQNEVDCRLIIVCGLREMRYPLKWNARLDDPDQEENWSLNLSLTQWCGSDGHGNYRFETHGNGMISVLRLNSMGLRDPIPERIRFLTTLYGLDLHSNYFTYLPDWICDFSYLSHLFLRFNQLETLPEGLDRLANLWHLDVAHNNISVIPPVLSRLPRMGELMIQNNPITCTDEGRDAVRLAVPNQLWTYNC